MIFHNLKTLSGEAKNIRIDGEKIVAVYSGDENFEHNGEHAIHFENCVVFPGLINSHDHLDFNLFPQLGGSNFKNYLDWGNTLRREHEPAIQAILKIPQKLRARWGVYKNLINGITTVVPHGESLHMDDAPITIFDRCYSLHSVALEKKWRYKLNRPFIPDHPFVIHIGEGTDKFSAEEIDQLLRWNLLERKIIGVHGVAMTEKQALKFEALVWCPDSNFFSLGATAPIDKIKTATKILFGTDSTLTAHWSIWQQLRTARATGLLTDAELIASVTTSPAAVWGLDHTGQLKENYYADLVISENKTDLFATDPEDIQLILHKGTVIYFDASLLPQLSYLATANYSKIFINDRCKYVLGRLDELISEIKKYAPGAIFPVETEAPVYN